MRFLDKPKSYREIGLEWDRIARLRADQVWSGVDRSYREILVPLALELAQIEDQDSVLDAGCGVGFLTSTLTDAGVNVMGLDISNESVLEARRRSPAGTFVHTTVEEFARDRSKIFSVIIANMVLMDTPFVDSFLQSARSLLFDRGRLIVTIPHPYFWPKYWGYDENDGFRYTDEIGVETPFRIAGQLAAPTSTTHYHRPISRYLRAFADAGFWVQNAVEVSGPDDREPYPRFMGFVARPLPSTTP